MFEYEGFEVAEMVREYHVFREDAPRDMVIKVYRYGSGKYEGRCNYSFWGPDQAGPYQRSVPESVTEDDAVKAVLRHMVSFYNPSYSKDQYAWIKDDPQETIVLGSGEVVSKEEFLAMRKERKSN